MQTAAFGSKIFEVSSSRQYTPDGINISESLNIEMQAIEGKKPATYIKGLNEMKLGFSVKLDARSVDVLAEINFWLAKLRSKTPEFLSIGGKVWGTNKMLLAEVKISDAKIIGKDVYSQASMDLSFAEYVSAGYAKQEGSASASTASSVSSNKVTKSKSTNHKAQQIKLEHTKKPSLETMSQDWKQTKISFLPSGTNSRGGGFTGAT